MRLHRRHLVIAGMPLAAENLGTTVVVGNKPCVGGNIAHELVARAPVDGTVILLGS